MAILNMIYWQGGSNVKVPLNAISNLSAIKWNSIATIKWSDPWDLTVNGVLVTSWVSTKLVRKVGSAPVDSSDGTLILTETVADTYSVTWYTDTGLTNWTTYYYWAFAVADNGLETISNISSATPDGAWSPSAKTVLYLPLNWDVTDPYNNVTYNWGVWTASYDTWDWATQAANFTGSNSISLWTSLDLTGGTWLMTVCFWFTTRSPSSEQRCSQNRNWTYFHICWITNSKVRLACMHTDSSTQTNITGTTTLTANTKYLYTATIQSNWDIKLYLNWQLEASWTVGVLHSLNFQFGQWIGSGRTWDSEFWNWMIKDFIVEDRIWTAQEIADYYTHTS